MQAEELEEARAAAEELGEEIEAADVELAGAGNDGIDYFSKVHEGWRLSYRQVEPEKTPAGT